MKNTKEEYLPVVRRLKEAVENPKVEYSNAFTLKGKELQPFTTDQETAAKISQEKQSMEKKFKSETELAEIVLNNGNGLFGEKTILIDCLKKNSIAFAGGFVPDGLLFDLQEPEKPKFYFVEVMLSKENLAELFLRITKLFSLFRTKENTGQFTATLAEAIRKNIGWRNKLKQAFGSKSAEEFLQELFSMHPAILLVMDAPIPELTGFTETYDSWGKYVKPILLRKFAINGDTIVTIVPTFTELSKKLNGKRNGSADKVIKATEEDHLQSTSESMKEIFLEIKKELLKADSSIEFRVKQHYISLRKNRNLAFFQLGKKKLSIVVANPEINTREQIKHHEIRTLADSVKKFWNGNEYCFTVVIESKEHLSEITSLLKKVAANGKPEKVKSDDPPWEQGEKTLPEGSAGSGRETKSQAKPGVKKSNKR